MAGPNPTLRRRQLANRLRELRQSKGMTIDEVAERLLVSAAKISRMETAKRGASLRDVRDLCQIYGVTDQPEIDALLTLAREANQPGLRAEHTSESDLAKFGPFADLEAAAESVTEFQSTAVPSLLQTEHYARALIRGVLPQISTTVLEARVAARMERKARIMQDGVPRYWAIFDEAALRRVVGDQSVLAEQLGHLIELAEQPNILIQVVPFEIGAYMSLDNSFVYFEFADPAVNDIVYLEGLNSADYLEKVTDLRIYREAVEHLRATALAPKRTTELIARIRASQPG
ncbi:helix-turn-helix domain-containing protein [Streptosporangiaceae bacterium NEAU-GS5]|nr:helix-turn-helix domain-containing protein [Streptosporangiaceae bacterium NEAU-GS5]